MNNILHDLKNISETSRIKAEQEQKNLVTYLQIMLEQAENGHISKVKNNIHNITEICFRCISNIRDVENIGEIVKKLKGSEGMKYAFTIELEKEDFKEIFEELEIKFSCDKLNKVLQIMELNSLDFEGELMYKLREVITEYVENIFKGE